MQNSKLFGFICCLAAYIVWGLFPYFYNFIKEVESIIILVCRATVSFLIAFVLVLISRNLKSLKRFTFSFKNIALSFLVALSLVGNWSFFILGVKEGEFFQISFAYFLCPLISIFFAIFFFKEVLSFLQKIALFFAFLGILTLFLSQNDKFPYIAVGIACSFSFYGALKKKLAAPLYDGLTIEFLLASLCFLFYYSFSFNTYVGTHFDYSSEMIFYLFLSGVFSIIPLLMYSESIGRLKLKTVSLIFYITPTMQFFITTFIIGEELNYQKFFSFLLIWIALIIYLYDLFFIRKVLKVS